MDIYLDANATTPVLPQARAAALAAMAEDFGNPSSVHGSGLRAHALLDRVRARARRVLDAPTGHMLFTSGATEGIQTAVLSALIELRTHRAAGGDMPTLLLYGATEHKAVPAALKHWNGLLGLDLAIQPIPVGRDGRHDLAWLAAHAPHAGLVCTMAANNETGVISDLDGIADALTSSPALWMVDSVQALGKLPLKLVERRIHYAPFSGHKLYAPKGVGLLYVREGAPFTPLLTGGGQEGAMRAGTENMAGIAAFGAVLEALERGQAFHSPATLHRHRQRLASALQSAFPGLVFNAPSDICLPTTLNVSVPGFSSQSLQSVFDAAGLRVSGGSACGASKAQPSDVLVAMGLPAWQAAGAIRLSFGAADDSDLIEAACTRIQACGTSLRAGGSVDDLELNAAQVLALRQTTPGTVLVDVRERHEQNGSGASPLGAGWAFESAPLSGLPEHLPRWLELPAEVPVVFCCQSGRRSTQAALALRQQGHALAFSLRPASPPPAGATAPATPMPATPAHPHGGPHG
ncbi:MAG: aminotransferase class V-fold PLP-dependent enzyme [Hydrogenophaga sp.]|uniref:aminotransferase class V-fold PLP-dependent enzyme n=1 Tax=Hydrogenophaga sp. TaxID=1904254 RepID=UPI003D10FAEC